MNATETLPIWKAGNSFIRKARKQWHCDCSLREFHGGPDESERHWCDAEIPIGARYLESVDNAAGYQSGDHYCWDCAEHQGLIQPEQPWQHKWCRLPYLDQQSTDPKSCVCGGEPDSWYEPVTP